MVVGKVVTVKHKSESKYARTLIEESSRSADIYKAGCNSIANRSQT